MSTESRETPSLQGRSRLPALLVLTDRRACERAGRSLVDGLAALPAREVAVILREKDLAPTERLALGRSVAAVLERAGIPLIVASDAALARDLGAAGVHLGASDQRVGLGAAGGAPGLLVGRSCHSAQELAEVTEDYATISPVFETASKPGYGPSLGVEGLSHAVAASAVPLYALGGISPGRAEACIAAGAWGVAVMGSVMAASDPAAVVTALVDEVETAKSEKAESEKAESEKAEVAGGEAVEAGRAGATR